jgi:DNA-binding MarR family transcriptional regulator
MKPKPAMPGCSPEDVMGTCALFHSRRAARAITTYFDTHLKRAGIKATQFSLLVAVSAARGRTLSEIAAFMAMDRTALARDLRVLEELGLIDIEAPENDRRTRLMTLTAKGTRVMNAGLPHWRDAQDGVERAMSGASWPHLLAGLQTATHLA